MQTHSCEMYKGHLVLALPVKIELSSCTDDHSWRPAQCGLDYGHREGLAGHKAQLHAFLAQLRLAVELHRPVSVRKCQQ